MKVVAFESRGSAALYFLSSLPFDFLLPVPGLLFVHMFSDSAISLWFFGILPCAQMLYLAAVDRLMRRTWSGGLRGGVRVLADGTALSLDKGLCAIGLSEDRIQPLTSSRGGGAVSFRCGPSVWLRLLVAVSGPVYGQLLFSPSFAMQWLYLYGLPVLCIFYGFVAWRYRTLTLSAEGIQLGRRRVAWKDVGKVSTIGQWLHVRVKGGLPLWARLLPTGGRRQTSDMAREVIEDGPAPFLPWIRASDDVGQPSAVKP